MGDEARLRAKPLLFDILLADVEEKMGRGQDRA